MNLVNFVNRTPVDDLYLFLWIVVVLAIPFALVSAVDDKTYGLSMRRSELRPLFRERYSPSLTVMVNAGVAAVIVIVFAAWLVVSFVRALI